MLVITTIWRAVLEKLAGAVVQNTLEGVGHMGASVRVLQQSQLDLSTVFRGKRTFFRTRLLRRVVEYRHGSFCDL
jgi:hypothetical protein